MNLILHERSGIGEVTQWLPRVVGGIFLGLQPNSYRKQHSVTAKSRVLGFPWADVRKAVMGADWRC